MSKKDKMPIDPKDLKIIIDPGAIADMEAHMSPEEVQKFIDELTEQIKSGALFENSEPVDLEQLAVEEPEIYAKIMEQEERFQDEDGEYKGPILH